MKTHNILVKVTDQDDYFDGSASFGILKINEETKNELLKLREVFDNANQIVLLHSIRSSYATRLELYQIDEDKDEDEAVSSFVEQNFESLLILSEEKIQELLKVSDEQIDTKLEVSVINEEGFFVSGHYENTNVIFETNNISYSFLEQLEF